MREVVLDSSVFIASLMPDELSEKAEQLIRQLDVSEARYHAPILLRYEVIAAARKAVYRKRMNAEQGRILRESLLAYRMTLYFDDALLRRTYELAETFNQPSTYDAQYLALSERLSCEFWTADERLFNGTRGYFPWVRWIGILPMNPI